MQKQILALHDLAGVGRSSLVPIIALLSAAGHQCVPLPTAVFSSHMALPQWTTVDLTAYLAEAIAQYTALSLRCEAIYAGFLNHVNQIAYVQTAVTQLKAPHGCFLLDPVMGDNGRVYAAYTSALGEQLQQLCRQADILTPNLTEAALLLGYAPDTQPANVEQVQTWAQRLGERYQAQIVITGVTGIAGVANGASVVGAAVSAISDSADTETGIVCFDGNTVSFFAHERIGGYYPGTGDIFAAVLLGCLLQGESLLEACRFAGAFVRDSIRYTQATQANPLYGVQIEPLLARIAARHGRDQQAEK